MTDVARALSVDERLALLEARLGIGVEPLAVVPPITVGSLSNVPAPGAQIAAQWAQDVTGLAVHRFANVAAIVSTWAAPNGALAVALDTGVIWRRVGGAWSQFTPWSASAFGNAENAGTKTIAQLTIPSDPGPRVADISCFMLVDVFSGYSCYIDLRFDGVGQAQASIPTTQQLSPAGTNMQWNISLRAANVPVPPSRAIIVSTVVTPSAPNAGAYHTYLANHQNRVDAVVYPRGY